MRTRTFLLNEVIGCYVDFQKVRVSEQRADLRGLSYYLCLRYKKYIFIFLTVTQVKIVWPNIVGKKTI